MGNLPNTASTSETTITLTADEIEAIGYAVDMFQLRAEDCAERGGKGHGDSTADLIHFYEGVSETLDALRARCAVPA